MHANAQNEDLKPYTMEEINEMLDEAERDFEAGRCYNTEQVLQMCLQEVQHVSELLEGNPRLGPIESLLVQKPQQNRSVVVSRLNKIVFYIKGNIIKKTAFEDSITKAAQNQKTKIEMTEIGDKDLRIGNKRLRSKECNCWHWFVLSRFHTIVCSLWKQVILGFFR